MVNKLLLWTAYLIIIGSHIYMLFIPLKMTEMLPHAVINIIALMVIFFNYGEHKRFF